MGVTRRRQIATRTVRISIPSSPSSRTKTDSPLLLSHSFYLSCRFFFTTPLSHFLKKKKKKLQNLYTLSFHSQSSLSLAEWKKNFTFSCHQKFPSVLPRHHRHSHFFFSQNFFVFRFFFFFSFSDVDRAIFFFFFTFLVFFFFANFVDLGGVWWSGVIPPRLETKVVSWRREARSRGRCWRLRWLPVPPLGRAAGRAPAWATTAAAAPAEEASRATPEVAAAPPGRRGVPT